MSITLTTTHTHTVGISPTKKKQKTKPKKKTALFRITNPSCPFKSWNGYKPTLKITVFWFYRESQHTSCSKVLSFRSMSLMAESSLTILLYTTASITTQLSFSTAFNLPLMEDEERIDELLGREDRNRTYVTLNHESEL